MFHRRDRDAAEYSEIKEKKKRELLRTQQLPFWGLETGVLHK